MVDREQIGIKLTLEALNIEPRLKNIQEISDTLYLVEKRGVYTISQGVIRYDANKNTTYRRVIRESSNNPGYNLENEIREIELNQEETSNYRLDKNSIEELEKLKIEIEEKGLENLLIEAGEIELLSS